MKIPLSATNQFCDVETYTFTYTNQLGETSKYTAVYPDFAALYRHDIEMVQGIVYNNSDPELLEAALELLNGLQSSEEDINLGNIDLRDGVCLMLVAEKVQIEPGKQPPVRHKKPKTILKDQIREKLLTSKLRYFYKKDMKY